MISSNKILVYSYTARDLRSDDEQFLAPEERQRAARFRFDRDRRLFVLGRRMARTVLSETIGAEPSSLKFRFSRFEKPDLADRSGHHRVAFNLAHSGDQIVFALAYGRRVGVDVEKEWALPVLLDIPRIYFCPAEVRALQGAGPEQRVRLFYKYWTLKEAYLKAEGSGLSISLMALDASVVPDAVPGLPHLPREDQPRYIRVQRIAAKDGYIAALAADGPAWELEQRFWTDAPCSSS